MPDMITASMIHLRSPSHLGSLQMLLMFGNLFLRLGLSTMILVVSSNAMTLSLLGLLFEEVSIILLLVFLFIILLLILV